MLECDIIFDISNILKLGVMCKYIFVVFCVVTGYVNYVGYWKWIMLFSVTTLVLAIVIIVVSIDYHITEKKGTSCFSIFIN